MVGRLGYPEGYAGLELAKIELDEHSCSTIKCSCRPGS